MQGRFIAVLFALLIWGMNAQASEQILFQIQGSNTIGARLAPELAAAYLQQQGLSELRTEQVAHNETRVRGFNAQAKRWQTVGISAHGSSSAFRGLSQGTAEIGAASRLIKSQEQQNLLGAGDMRSAQAEQVVAIDGIAVIVHPSNLVSELTIEQIAQLFSGEVSNWAELGGFDLPVNLYARDEQSGTWDTFQKLVLGKKRSLSTKAERFESNGYLSNLVNNDPGAIGFVSLNTIGNNKALAVASGNTQALKPNFLTVATEDYPLARRLFFYRKPDAVNGDVEHFIDFVASPMGQDIVAKAGYVEQNIRALDPPLDTAASDSYREQVSGLQRLSVNFRFINGKATLDNKALADLQRLARYQQSNPELSLRLIGFGEDRKGARFSQLLSELRAKVVRRALVRAGVSRDRISAIGQGAYRPLQRGEDLIARVRNRRVEVWLRE